MSINKNFLEKAYENPEKVPWYETEIPKELKDLVESKKILPGKLLDIGSGTGHHSIYLAKKGFQVTGIDISHKAIEYARQKAQDNKVKINFQVVDALNLNEIKDKFNFILDWGVLHFIPFEKRKIYTKSVSQLLTKEGKYLSLSFNEESPEWGGGKVRKGVTGSTVYYSNIEELKELFSPYFKILEIKKRKTFFKNSKIEHIHNYILMVKL